MALSSCLELHDSSKRRIGKEPARRKGSRKRLSLSILRCSEEGVGPPTPGKRCAKKRSASRRNDRSLSTPRRCYKSANVRTSESESFLSDTYPSALGLRKR
jgi:hypothetical protein